MATHFSMLKDYPKKFRELGLEGQAQKSRNIKGIRNKIPIRTLSTERVLVPNLKYSEFTYFTIGVPIK